MPMMKTKVTTKAPRHPVEWEAHHGSSWHRQFLRRDGLLFALG